MPLQCDICERIPIFPILLDIPTLRRNKFRDPRIMRTRSTTSGEGSPPEPFQQSGRAVVPRRLSIEAAQQHSPTRKRFMVTNRVNFRNEATREPDQRCAAFMPLQCDICERIPIFPMLLDMPSLRRNKFRDPRIIRTRSTTSGKGPTNEPFQQSGRAVPQHSLPRNGSCSQIRLSMNRHNAARFWTSPLDVRFCESS